MKRKGKLPSKGLAVQADGMSQQIDKARWVRGIMGVSDPQSFVC